MNRIFRSGRGTPRTISDRTVSGALLPCTAVFVGATQFIQATTASGGRLALLADRDFYGAAPYDASEPLKSAYASGETGVAIVLQPTDEVAWAMAAGTYTASQELTVGAGGRLTAAATGDVVVAHLDQAGMTFAAGELADVVVANFYRKA